MADVATSPLRSPRRCGKVADLPSSSASSMGTLRCGSSPPSPELERPPMRFTAMAIASWHSREMAPRDMPPVQKRSQMSATDSTSSMSIGFRSDSMTSMSRREVAGRSLRCSSYSLYASADPSPLPPRSTALCSSLDISWLFAWYSRPGFTWNIPRAATSEIASPSAPALEEANIAVSAASSSKFNPPTRLTVPLNATSMSSGPMP
mmetsp:Transcript_101/g.413  ORF Transcript_101/g.413 Transcript_101/m.413 type:complete len:206 (+) Transcript_101:1898-2515(+)